MTDHNDHNATDSDQVRSLRAEAKARRLELRETEQQRDNLAAQLQESESRLHTWKKAEVQRLARQLVKMPETLESMGFDPSAFVSDDMTIDTAAATAEIKRLRDQHGLAPATDAPTQLAKDIAAELDNGAGEPIPAHLLRGTTADQLRAHRDQLLDFLHERFPVMPVIQGESAGTHSPLTTETDWLTEKVNNLKG